MSFNSEAEMHTIPVPEALDAGHRHRLERKSQPSKGFHLLPLIFPYSHLSPIVLMAQVSPENVKSPTLCGVLRRVKIGYG